MTSLCTRERGVDNQARCGAGFLLQGNAEVLALIADARDGFPWLQLRRSVVDDPISMGASFLWSKAGQETCQE
jgi:hypothetical protein